MPHTIALVWRLKRVALFPRWAKTQRVHPEYTPREDPQGQPPQIPMLQVQLGSSSKQQTDVKITKSEKFASNFSRRKQQREQKYLVRPAWLENSPMVNRKRLPTQKKGPTAEDA